MNQSNVAELETAGELFRQYGGRKVAQEIIKRGGGLDEFHLRISSAIQKTAPDKALGLDLSKKELSRYSITRAIASQAYRNPRLAEFEHEVSNEIQKQTGSAASGMAVPFSVLSRDFNVGTSTQAGNLTGAPIPGQYTADPLVNLLSLARLGATIAAGFRADFTIPRLSSPDSGGFVTEVQATTETNPTTTQAVFAAKRYGSYIEYSKQALLQATPQMDALLQREMYQRSMSRFEEQMINGDGTSGAPTGIRNVAGIGTVIGGVNGAQLDYTHLADLEAAPGTANAPERSPGFLMNSKTRRWLRTKAAGSGLPYIWESKDRPVLGYPVAISNNLPSNLTKGASSGVCSSLLYSSDWALAMVAIFGAPDLIVDPVTQADRGMCRIHLHIYGAANVLQLGAFAKMDDALTA